MYYLCAFYLIYSVLGWVVEVVYHVIKQGKIVNRGYLNGPVCPIYGIGMVAVITCLQQYSDNNYMIFIGGMVLATAIEFVGGYALFHFFHQRWWDYSNEPFNIGGYICPRFAILWGIGAVLVMNMIHPPVELIVEIIPVTLGWILIVIFSIIHFIDLCATTVSVLHMKKEFERLDAIGKSMRAISDEMTQVIGNKTIELEQQVDTGLVQIALGKAELEKKYEAGNAGLKHRIEIGKNELIDTVAEQKLQAKLGQMELESKLNELKRRQKEAIRQLNHNKYFGSGRILTAYPNLKNRIKL